MIASFEYIHKVVPWEIDQRWTPVTASYSKALADYLHSKQIVEVELPLLRDMMELDEEAMTSTESPGPFTIHGLGLNGEALQLAPPALVIKNGGVSRG